MNDNRNKNKNNLYIIQRKDDNDTNQEITNQYLFQKPSTNNDLFYEARYICKMSRKKIDRTETGLKVHDINAKGMGVAKNEEGQVVFVEDVAPGDVVDVLVYKKRKGYLLGSVKEIKKYSITEFYFEFYHSHHIQIKTESQLDDCHQKMMMMVILI